MLHKQVINSFTHQYGTGNTRPSGEIIQFAELVRVQIRYESWSGRLSHVSLYKLSYGRCQGLLHSPARRPLAPGAPAAGNWGMRLGIESCLATKAFAACAGGPTKFW